MGSDPCGRIVRWCRFGERRGLYACTTEAPETYAAEAAEKPDSKIWHPFVDRFRTELSALSDEMRGTLAAIRGLTNQ